MTTVRLLDAPRTGLLSEVERVHPSALLPARNCHVGSLFHDMLIPALSPEHAPLLTFPPTGRLPSTISAADLRPALFEAFHRLDRASLLAHRILNPGQERTTAR